MSQPDIKQIIRDEYVKCASSPAHFMRKFCKISHPMKGMIPFALFPFQAKVLDIIKNDENSIILKSRQLGISTLAAGYSLWLMLFHQNKNILCIATKQDTAKNMVTKVKLMYNHLPMWLKEKKLDGSFNKPLEESKLTLRLNNESQIKATSASSDSGRSEAVSLLLIDEAAFINGIGEIWASAQQTLATGGKCIALSTPYGTGNWFHKTWVQAEENLNGFVPIRLPWFVHPERDQAWRDQQDAELGIKDAAQECDCDFSTSGDTVFHSDWLTKIEETTIQEPKEYRGADSNLWIFEHVDYSKDYMVIADVARGDGKDFSAFHVLDIATNTQVAEYKSQIPTKEFGSLLVSIATEYNNALLVIENASIGWSTIEAVKERGYSNLYHTPKSNNVESNYMDMIDGSSSSTAGFTMSLRTRPLCINKLREYIGEDSVTIRSSRTLSEMKTFIWKNGRAEAQSGYNDDLVMPLSIGMFMRDTSLRFQSQNLDMTKAALDGIKNNKNNAQTRAAYSNQSIDNPYKMNINGESTDIKWLL